MNPSTSRYDALRAGAERFRVPIADLSLANRGAAETLPERWARRFNVLPLAVTDRRLVVATSDPFDVDCERTLAFATGREVAFAYALPADITRRIDEVYRPEAAVSSVAPAAMIDLQLLGNDAEHGSMDG